jgi:dynein heavy chain
VAKERPDLSAQREELIQQQNQFKITLGELEADLLKRLAEQSGDILADLELIENLEKSKELSTEIKEKVEIAKNTEVAIIDASEVYRPAANRGALVFFLMNELYRIHTFYRFSLDSFVIVVGRAIDIVADSLNPKKQRALAAAAAAAEKAAAGGGDEEDKKDDEDGEGQGDDDEEEEEDEELEMTPRTLNARVQKIVD